MAQQAVCFLVCVALLGWAWAGVGYGVFDRVCAWELGLGESVVGRWVKLERDRRQAAEQGHPNRREIDAEITVLRWRLRELEKENELLGKASAFFALWHQDAMGLGWCC